ncbi:MAG: acyltransferase family protein [Pirellulaceae bacterium]
MDESAMQPGKIESTTDEAIQSEVSSAKNAGGVSGRLLSIDAFRGLVMFLMLAEILRLHRLAEQYPGNAFFEWVSFHTSHVAWEGCSLHDLIQPAFTFLVGVSMPFSIASRLKRGSSVASMLLHAAWRAFLLVALGIILRSLHSERTYFTFEDTLTQIGLGYFFAFLVALAPRWVHYASAFGILLVFWGAFAATPAPPAEFDYPAVGVPEDWPHHYEGFASRWNKNSNLSWQVDKWFLNLFPREEPFEFNSGGYSTLSFIPTLGTMLFGLLAGVWLRERRGATAVGVRFGLAAVIGIASGWLLSEFGVCPLVKKIWTPSFALYSGGICMAWLYALHWVCDEKKWNGWEFPFLVIGSNSILIYVMSWTIAEPIKEMILRHMKDTPLALLGEAIAKPFAGAATLAILFAMLLWLYRRKAFVKI